MNEMISDFEELWGLKFRDMHQALLQRPYDDPEILKLGLLVIGADIELMNIDHVNEMVHDEDRIMPWPDDLIAFATNEWVITLHIESMDRKAILSMLDLRMPRR